MTPTRLHPTRPHRARRETGRARGDDGVVGINLAIVLAFALYAVIQLSRTTLAAQEIDDTVESIVVSTPAIDQTLDNVPKLDETDATAEQILVAAEPLVGHLESVIASADGILGTAGTINSTAGSINGTVLSIGDTVGSINGTVANIGGTFDVLTPEVASIRNEVAMINGRVSIVIGLARAIETDTTDISTSVGLADSSDNDGTIGGNADSICRALIVGNCG